MAESTAPRCRSCATTTDRRAASVARRRRDHGRARRRGRRSHRGARHRRARTARAPPQPGSVLTGRAGEGVPDVRGRSGPSGSSACSTPRDHDHARQQHVERRRRRGRERSSRASEFGGRESGSMGFDLVFDTTDTGDAGHQVHQQAAQARWRSTTSLPGTDETASNARPPYVIFHWGQLHSFKAVITTADVTFDYFSASGVPLRAKVVLTLTAVRGSRRVHQAEPDLGHPPAAPGAPGAARRDAGPDQRPLLRRLDPVAPAGRGQRHRGPAGDASRLAALGIPEMGSLDERDRRDRARSIKVDGSTLSDRARAPGHRAGRARRSGCSAGPRCASPTSATACPPARTSRSGTKVDDRGTGHGPTVRGHRHRREPRAAARAASPKLVVVVDDAAYKLTRGTEVKTYLNVTLLAMSSEDRQRHGLRPAIELHARW